MIIITNPQGYSALILITRERRGGIHSEYQYATQIRIMQPSTFPMLPDVLEDSTHKKYVPEWRDLHVQNLLDPQDRVGDVEKLF